ncbi:MAG: ABC-F family ATP-binding cassette domain-containing protein [Catenibacillus sp.]
MNIINIEHISKTFGDKVIFEDASFGIHEGDKVGIIGINGTGKSTLLKMIAGQEMPDSGQIVRQNGLTVACLPQNPVFAPGATVMSYIQEGGVEESWLIQSNLSRLGMAADETPVDTLSGGQKRKLALARLLAEDFNVLLLDEPTNHLDNEMIAWLEDYLRSYKGVVLMVTHDRYFLDRVSNRILEISHGKMYGYDANYSRFLELKAQREEMALASERKRQSILRMELEWAKRGCRARTTKQKARLERLELLKGGSAPIEDQTVEMDSVETRMGRKTIELHHVSKSYGERELIRDFDYIVLKNQRLGIIGPNGCGKSTLIKMMAGLLEPDSGSVEIGETVKIGYLAQEEPDMDTNQRVIDYIKDIGEYVQTKEGRISASQMLERFLFTPDMQYTPIAKLSGGERRRLYLLSVLMGGVNALILDEPSNNVDIPTLAVFEDYLNSFVGIVITVSHDRYFLDNVVDRIFEFDGNGGLVQYEGGYTDYVEAKTRKYGSDSRIMNRAGSGEKVSGSKVSVLKASDGFKADTDGSESFKSWKQNRQARLKFTYKEQKEFETIDDEIAALEAKLSAIETDMLANATNSGKLNDLMKEKDETQVLLDEKMDRWVYLNDLAEQIEAQNKK